MFGLLVLLNVKILFEVCSLSFSATVHKADEALNFYHDTFSYNGSGLERISVTTITFLLRTILPLKKIILVDINVTKVKLPRVPHLGKTLVTHCKWDQV